MNVELGYNPLAVTSIDSPNGVLLCVNSMESSPFIVAPVRLDIIPVSIDILMSIVDQIGTGWTMTRFLKNVVTTVSSKISSVDIVRVNG